MLLGNIDANNLHNIHVLVHVFNRKNLNTILLKFVLLMISNVKQSLKYYTCINVLSGQVKQSLK